MRGAKVAILRKNKLKNNIMDTTDQQIDREYDNCLSAIISYGSMDIRRAVTVSLEVGEDGDWIAELVQEFSESCEVRLNDVDIVSAVYEDILQTSRTEIEDLINFDFCNDGADIYTAGNYCETSYDYSDNANETIKDKLIENSILFADLSVKLQWFLTEIEAEY